MTTEIIRMMSYEGVIIRLHIDIKKFTLKELLKRVRVRDATKFTSFLAEFSNCETKNKKPIDQAAVES